MSGQAYLDILEDLEQTEYPESTQDANASEALGGHIQCLAQTPIW